MLPTEWHQDSFIGVSSGAHRQFDIDFKRIRALGAVAMHYVFVARGVSVAVLHRQVKVWDITAAYAILSGVGGIAMTLDGRQLSFQEILTESEKKTPILVGHPQVVERLRSRIKVR
jgi:fructose-1,6-bisphosphatase/inositol monophosphatase family enzyme